jgi:hypothetical protein
MPMDVRRGLETGTTRGSEVAAAELPDRTAGHQKDDGRVCVS